MGCCWSCEEDEVDRLRRTQYANQYVRRTPTIPRPTPTTSNVRSSYEPYSLRVNESINEYVQPSRIYVQRTVQIVPRVQPTQVNNNVRRDHILPIQKVVTNQREWRVQPSQVDKSKPEPLYGEFKCIECGHKWLSLMSWRDAYQICKRCKAKVRPKNQRSVLPTDFTRDKEDVGEHPKELCEKCCQLGRYCGRYNK